MKSPVHSEIFKPGSVVGAVHCLPDLREAAKLNPGDVDLLEIRIDAFAENLRTVEERIPQLRAPILLTARDSSEGGNPALSAQQRIDLLLRFLPFAKLVDVELRNAPAMADVLSMARDAGTGIVLSHHDFKKMPPPSFLRDASARAAKAGADCFKVAAMASNASDLITLVTAIQSIRRPLTAAMGMGPFGRLSRIILGTLGSVLNYGYLTRPNAPGQWHAPTLKKRIIEMRSQPPTASPRS